MHILINGEAVEVAEGASLLDCLEITQDVSKKWAVALGGVVVPKHQYADTVLKEGSEIDILIPMQGG
jgi:sulfur carrier protein